MSYKEPTMMDAGYFYAPYPDLPCEASLYTYTPEPDDPPISKFLDEAAACYDRHCMRLGFAPGQDNRTQTIREMCEVIEEKYEYIDFTEDQAELDQAKADFKAYVFNMVGKYLEAVQNELHRNDSG